MTTSAPSKEPTALTPPVDAGDLGPAIEALLLSSERALAPARMVEALGLEKKDGSKRVEGAIDALNREYGESGRCFRIERIAGGFRAVTLARFAPLLAAFHGLGASASLSRAALETLAIVAYRQPITRAQIEAIRGVATGEVLKTLLEKRLVEITGRAEELGRPMLYGTTRRFLEVFGLAAVKDLPAIEDEPPSAPQSESRSGPESEPRGNANDPADADAPQEHDG